MTLKQEPRTIAYIRVSTDDQDVDKQRLEILDYAYRKGVHIDEFVSVEMSSRKTTKERRIDEVVEKLKEGDTLITPEFSRLGRTIMEIIGLVNALARKKVRLLTLKENFDLQGEQDMTSKIMVTIFSLIAEIERDLISRRTKEGLAAVRMRGKTLGRPKGSIGKSRLDEWEEEIKGLLEFKVSKSAIARKLKVSRGNLISFIRKRGIAEIGPPPRRKNGKNGSKK